MDSIEQTAKLLEEAETDSDLLNVLVQGQLAILDQVVKVRKELRTRNVTSSPSLDFEGQSPSDGGEHGE